MTKSAVIAAPSGAGKAAQATFELQERAQVLEVLDEKPIMVHIAVAEGEKYPYEMLFRSIHRHLCDAATNEYAFCVRFFSAADGRASFNNAFTKTLSATLEGLENHLFTSHDPVALLLLLRLTHMFRTQMKGRGVNVLDNFHDRMDMLIWPRVKAVVDNNIRSVRACVSSPKKVRECGEERKDEGVVRSESVA